MKFYYYYLRDEKKRPLVTICLAEDGGEVARGVSVCSLLDTPCKKEGKRLARAQAQKALGTKESGNVCFTENARAVLDLLVPEHQVFVPFLKSVYDPFLSDFEKNIIEMNTS